jgi:hypothetical protein
MSTYKFTGLGVGSAATDSANLSQVQSTVTKLLTSVSGTDTITAVGAPVVAAYAAGQMFYFVATGDNTGAVTLNIDSLGAKAVTRDGSVALAAGDIKSGEVVVVVYDGTRFQVVSQLNSAGNATFANVSITSALNVGGVATFSAGTAAAPSITTTGDTNTGIFFPAADTIAFTEGGVEAARFDSSGNLGIGTTSPSAKLHVVGSQYRQNDSTGSFGFTLNTTSSTTTLATLFGGSSFAIQTGGSGTNQLTLDSSGNLGIGTSSPAFALGSGVEIQRAGIATLRLENSSGANALEIAADSTTNGIRFYGINNAPFVFAPNATEFMRLDTAGNLGIGTSSPVFANGSGIEIERAGAATLRLQDSSTTNSFELYVDSNVHVRGRDSMATIFYTSDVERARITPAGNIVAGASAALATTATNGFLYVPTCAGTPTGTPTAITGMAPIVVDTTNNKLYFYSTGVWRDAGP